MYEGDSNLVLNTSVLDEILERLTAIEAKLDAFEAQANDAQAALAPIVERMAAAQNLLGRFSGSR